MKDLILKIVDNLNLYRLFNRYTRNTATIFMMHAIASQTNPDSSGMDPNLLESFFIFLRENDYQVLSLKQYVQKLREKKATYKAVVFTVDDGYRDFYLNAFDIFCNYGYPATIFLTSDYIDRKLFFWWDQIEYVINNTSKEKLDLSFMERGDVTLSNATDRNESIKLITRYCKTLSNDNKIKLLNHLVEILKVDISSQPNGKYEPLKWSEIAEMQKHGIDFHPHTKTHPIMSKVELEQKRIEIIQPKQRIENQLNSKADIFCYPNGQWVDFDEEVISELKNAGYIAAVTGVEGFDNTQSQTDMFRLKRYPIPSDELRFKQYVCGLENLKRRYLG
ncbi:MAG: hypothetical protein DRP47_06980 [Candidatus Zixiibacteriota bacterium]|nr:MAG: hypothetical protein DRP47_06980 [candidate division Zixibacteria bacterium]